MPALQRLGWARALMAARGKYGASWKTDPEQVKAYKSALGYRDRLLGRRSGGLDKIDPFTPLATLHDLSGYLDSLANAGDSERRQAAAHARFLAEHASSRALPGQISDVLQAKREIFDKLNQIGLGDPSQSLAEMYVDLSADQTIGVLEEEAKRAYQEYEKAQAQMQEIHEDYKRKTDGIWSPYNAAYAKYRRLETSGFPDPDLEEKTEQARLDAERLWNETNAAIQEHTERANEALKRSQEWAEAPLRSLGARFIKRILDESPVSQEQADVWADAVEINKSLKAKLKKIDYPQARFRADIAEFYRLVGGRIKNIRFSADGGKRAYASGVKDVSGGSVAVTSRFTKRSLFHEMAHHLESDPVANAMALAFLRDRRTSSKTVSLRKLTGHDGFRPDERAWEDHFLDPYVGKHYPDELTEVFSMGVERFADPLKLALAVAQDPHHMRLITGYTRLPGSPVFEAVKTIAEAEAGVEAEAKESKQAEIDTYLDIIDRRVKLEIAPEEDLFKGDTLVRLHGLQKYLGRLGKYSVYKAKGRYLDGTKRLKPCTRLLYITEHSPSPSYDYATLPDDIRWVKAIYARNKRDGSPISVSRFELADLKAVAKFLESSNA